MRKNKRLISVVMILILLIPCSKTFAFPPTEDPQLPDAIRKLVTTEGQQVEEPDWHFGTNQVPVFTLDHRQMVVSSGCDVNGDGYDDVLVGDGDYDHQNTSDDNGRVWLFYGSSEGLNTTPDVTFTPPYINTYGFFGANAVCAGDVNGDGFDDIIISESNYDYNYQDEGAIFVYYGSETGIDTTYDWMARSNVLWAHFGRQVDSAGDVNNDGYDDIIVGTTENYITTNVFVWFGGEGGLGDNGLPSNADWTASGSSGSWGYGQVVRGIGDVNGDSYDDIMIGADLYDGDWPNQGAVFVYYGSEDGLGDPGTHTNADWKATSGQTSSYFGFSGDGIGDLDGDGFDDLAVGAYAYDNPETNEGKVFVWHGSEDGLNLGVAGNPGNADWSAEINLSSNFGYDVGSGGDVNQDGYADLLATAPYYNFDAQGAPLNGAGAWFIWTGSEDGLGENGTLTNADYAGFGDQEGGYLGRNNAGVADVYNDGANDVFVAAYRYDDPETDEGVVFGYDFVPQGSISGMISCTGSLADSTHTVFVDLWMGSVDGPPDDSKHINCGDSYTFDQLPNGSYYLDAWMDVNDSGGGPPEEGEPAAWYDTDSDGEPDVIEITNWSEITYIDVELIGLEVSLSSATYTVGEAGGTVIINAELNLPFALPITVDYATSALTATSGTDYNAASGTLTFPVLETIQIFEVPITDDELYEGDETFNVTLSTPSNAFLGETSAAVVTITDDDDPPVVSLSRADYGSLESGPNVTIVVTISRDRQHNVTIDYETSDGTATADEDYAATSGTLTLLPTDQTQAFTVDILEDSLYEGIEHFIVTISNPVGATLGEASSAVVSITDNDPQPEEDFDLFLPLILR